MRVVEKTGKSYTVKGDVGLTGLNPECRVYMELSEEVQHYRFSTSVIKAGFCLLYNVVNYEVLC